MCTAEVHKGARILHKVKSSLNMFSLFQESLKSTKSTTKPASSSSGKDGGVENLEEVRLFPWIRQCTRAVRGMTSFILAASGCSAR